MHCKTGNVLSMLNVHITTENVKFILKKMSSNVRQLPGFLVIAKDLICVIKFL